MAAQVSALTNPDINANHAMDNVKTRQVLEINDLGIVDYSKTWQAMMDYTEQRNAESSDQLWCLQHHAVYTTGRSRASKHLLEHDKKTPVVLSDRGGDITWHGVGQLIIYFLLDLRRRSLGVRDLVDIIENSIIELLSSWDIHAHKKKRAPGVYVGQQKIASLGLRVRHGCCYHGLSLNINPDLKPFTMINPCGYAGLEVCSMQSLLDFERMPTFDRVNKLLLAMLCQRLDHQALPCSE